MKVHPAPPMNRTINLQYDVAGGLNRGCRQKKLQRLPHVFTKVLELPFRWDADVEIVEAPDSLRFSAVVADGICSGVWADAVEIYPGVTKLVVRGDGVVDLSAAEFDLDVWRFRLPGSMRPELAYAACEDGKLVVVVPKGAEEAEDDDAAGIEGGSLVFVL